MTFNKPFLRDWYFTVEAFGRFGLLRVKLHYEPSYDEDAGEPPPPVFRKHWGFTIIPFSAPRRSRQISPVEGPWKSEGWFGHSRSGYDRMNSHYGLGPLRFHYATPGNHMHWLGTNEAWLALVSQSPSRTRAPVPEAPPTSTGDYRSGL